MTSWTMIRPLALSAWLLAAAGGMCPALGQGATDGTAACDVAGAAAEQRYGLPPGLLQAIGRVESGRRDPASGRVTAWPWTINAEGRGHSFAGAADAVASTQALQRAGVSSIDVGCFQVNLVHHPLAFATLEDGFDPARNADYAGRFLQSLHARSGSWDSAVAAYHSSTPELGEPYRDMVVAGWLRNGSAGAALATFAREAAAPAAAVIAGPPVIRVMTFTAAKPGGGMRIWTPSAAGQGASIVRITRG